MPSLDRGQAGLAAILALALLAATLFANVMYVNANTDHKRWTAPTTVNEERIVAIAGIQSEPGDRVSVNWVPFRLLTGSPAASVDFYVTEPGEGALLLNGTTPSHVYASFTNVTIGSDVGDLEPLTIVRPPVNESPVEGRLRPDVTSLELVWVFHPASGDSFPGNATLQEHLAEQFEGGGLSATDVSIVRADAVDAQPYFYAAEAVLALTVVALAGLGAWPRSGQPRLDEASQTEALIALVDRGERHLVNVRNVLALTGTLLVFLGLFGTVAVEEVFLQAIQPGAPGASWDTWITRGFAFVYLVLVATWLATLVAVQRALNRWRANVADRPLEG